MYIVVICSFLALILTFLEYRGQARNGMMWGFVIVTFLGMIHYNYGNDYVSYYNGYQIITSYTFNLNSILAGDVYREPGWTILCWLFKPIGGFFMMVAVLNIIQNAIVYRFIKLNLEKGQWTFAVFIYLFVTSFYLMSFSMMRQMFVIIMFLGMWKYMIERKWWIPLIVIYICSFVHGSALVLLPFAFWGFLPMNNAKYVGIVYAVLLVILWLSSETLNSMFQFIMRIDNDFAEYAERYEDDDVGLKHGFGFIINMIPFVLSIMFLMSRNNELTVEQKRLVALSAIFFLIMPFGQIIKLVGRLGIYFGVYNIGAIPLIYGNIKKIEFRNGLQALYVLIILYDYINFFNSPIFGEKYSTFHTIFSVL